jgi:hypothetical protein
VPNKAMNLTAIPRRSLAAGELIVPVNSEQEALDAYASKPRHSFRGQVKKYKVIFKQGETDMGDKGKKDKGKREQHKKAQLNPKEKRQLKKEKNNN